MAGSRNTAAGNHLPRHNVEKGEMWLGYTTGALTYASGIVPYNEILLSRSPPGWLRPHPQVQMTSTGFFSRFWKRADLRSPVLQHIYGRFWIESFLATVLGISCVFGTVLFQRLVEWWPIALFQCVIRKQVALLCRNMQGDDEAGFPGFPGFPLRFHSQHSWRTGEFCADFRSSPESKPNEDWRPINQ